MKVLYSVSKNKSERVFGWIIRGFSTSLYVFVRSNYTSPITTALRICQGFKICVNWRKTTFLKHWDGQNWQHVYANALWDGMQSLCALTSRNSLNEFLPAFVLPLANLLFEIIRDPQRLRLNSLLGCGLMFIAAGACSACWTKNHKKNNLYFSTQMMWNLDHG